MRASQAEVSASPPRGVSASLMSPVKSSPSGRTDHDGHVMTPSSAKITSPTTPMSDFQKFAEILSPLTPIEDSSSSTRAPSSRDWATYQNQLSAADFDAEFVSTKKRGEDLYQPLHSVGALRQGIPLAGEISKNIFSVDFSAQSQLMSNTRALTSRLSKSKDNSKSQEKAERFLFNGDISNPFIQVGPSGTPVQYANVMVGPYRTAVKGVERSNVGVSSTQSHNGMYSSYEFGGDNRQVGILSHQQDVPGIAFAQHMQETQKRNKLMTHNRSTKNEETFNMSTPSRKDLKGMKHTGSNEDYDLLLLRAAEAALAFTPPVNSDGSKRRRLDGVDASPMVSKNSPGISFSPMQASSEQTQSLSKSVSCNCRKSQCLKLYCDCFRVQKYCEGCNCHNCANGPDNEDLRQRSMASITERNPEAFKPRIASNSPNKIVGEGVTESLISNFESNATSNSVQFHFSGCHCKKSACLKKYCECYQAQIPCQTRCRCQDCKNTLNDNVFYESSSRQGTDMISGSEFDNDAALLGERNNFVIDRSNMLLRNENFIKSENFQDKNSLAPISALYEKLPSVVRRGETLINRDLSTSREMSTVSSNSEDTFENAFVNESHKHSSDAVSADSSIVMSSEKSVLLTPENNYKSSSSANNFTTPTTPYISNVSVEFISELIASRLKTLGKAASNEDTEMAIRQELVQLFEKGILMSPQEYQKTNMLID